MEKKKKKEIHVQTKLIDDAITYWPVLIISESKPRHSSMRCFFCATASESMYKWARRRESGTGLCEMANCYTWIPLVSLDSWQGYDLQRIFSTSWVFTGVYLPCLVSKFQVAFSRSCWFYTYLPFKPGKRERERDSWHINNIQLLLKQHPIKFTLFWATKDLFPPLSFTFEPIHQPHCMGVTYCRSLDTQNFLFFSFLLIIPSWQRG